jgi:hypothetical protein
MVRIAFELFLVMHGLVHLLYFGQSARYFELQAGLAWPDGSWAFSRLLDGGATRMLASSLLILAAIGFATAGIGVFFRQAWFRPVIVGAAAFSTLIYILFWDGGWQNLDGKGGVGILINLAIIAVVLLFQWPNIDA